MTDPTLKDLARAALDVDGAHPILLTGEGFRGPRLLLGIRSQHAMSSRALTEDNARVELTRLISRFDDDDDDNDDDVPLDDALPTVLLLTHEAGVVLFGARPRADVGTLVGPCAWMRIPRTEISVVDGKPTVRGDRELFARVRQLATTRPAETRTDDGGDDDDDDAMSMRTDDNARRRHLARIQTALTSIFDGDYYQTNLAHPLTLGGRTKTAWLTHFYRRQRENTPRFSAFVDDGAGGFLVSLSPECLFSLTAPDDNGARIVTTQPIKGTRPRGATFEIDDENRRALSSSEKDCAEHVMIVDLLRNDVARVSVPGTVTVTSLAHVISTSSVHHLESTIEGALRDDVTTAHVVNALSPGGSITGAPKGTAIDAITDLEGAPRGPYTGTLVVKEPDGSVRASILIRTVVVTPDGAATLHVGGGIVADSDPADEWAETLQKARAFGVVDDGGPR